MRPMKPMQNHGCWGTPMWDRLKLREVKANGSWGPSHAKCAHWLDMLPDRYSLSWVKRALLSCEVSSAFTIIQQHLCNSVLFVCHHSGRMNVSSLNVQHVPLGWIGQLNVTHFLIRREPRTLHVRHYSAGVTQLFFVYVQSLFLYLMLPFWVHFL